MPKRKEPPLSPEEQSQRFNAEVRRLIDAGELSPTDADAALDGLVRLQKKERPPEPKP
jgi:hypothetical protein